MDQSSSFVLAVGIVAVCGSVLVVVGLLRAASQSVVIGASVLMMAGGALAAHSSSDEGLK